MQGYCQELYKLCLRWNHFRIYDPAYSNDGQLATAHWVTEQGLFVTLHDEQRSDFVSLKYKIFVVDHKLVKPSIFDSH